MFNRMSISAVIVALLIIVLIFSQTFGRYVEPLPYVPQITVSLPKKGGRKNGEEPQEEEPQDKEHKSAYDSIMVLNIRDYFRDYKHPNIAEYEKLELNFGRNWYYIGRAASITGAPSPLKNPNYNKANPGSTLPAYRKHLFKAIKDQSTQANRDILSELARIKPGAALLCHCANPDKCHGSIVKSAVKWLNETDEGKRILAGKAPSVVRRITLKTKPLTSKTEIQAMEAYRQEVERQARKPRTQKTPWQAGDTVTFVNGRGERTPMKIETIRYKFYPKTSPGEQYQPEDFYIKQPWIDAKTGEPTTISRARIIYAELTNASTKEHVVYSDNMRWIQLEQHNPLLIVTPKPEKPQLKRGNLIEYQNVAARIEGIRYSADNEPIYVIARELAGERRELRIANTLEEPNHIEESITRLDLAPPAKMSKLERRPENRDAHEPLPADAYSIMNNAELRIRRRRTLDRLHAEIMEEEEARLMVEETYGPDANDDDRPDYELVSLEHMNEIHDQTIV